MTTIRPEHTHILVTGAGYWGRGETLKDAIAAYKSNGVSNITDCTVWRCTANTRVTEHGCIARRVGEPAEVEIGTLGPRGGLHPFKECAQ